MKKFFIILLLAFLFNIPANVNAVEQNSSDPLQTIKTNKVKMEQNFNGFSTEEKAQAEKLLEKAANMLPEEEETELRALIKKASTDLNSLSSEEFKRLSELQMKALKLLPKEDYEKIMSLSTKLRE